MRSKVGIARAGEPQAMRSVVMLGAGGHARVLLDALMLMSRSILGIVDPALPRGSEGPFGINVLGGDDALECLGRDEVALVNGLGSTQSMERRHVLYARCRGRGFQFTSVVHPAAIISNSAKLADDVQVMAGCVVQTGAIVGPNTIINTQASVDHDCRIGKSVHIAPGVTLSGGVSVGDGAHIGTGAVVIQGISIGPNALVAAGTLVNRDVPAGSRLVQRS